MHKYKFRFRFLCILCLVGDILGGRFKSWCAAAVRKMNLVLEGDVDGT